MDKTVKINLAGILFHIDEKAYIMLRNYLQAIDNRLKNIQGGTETLDDIEARIAEIFQAQKNATGIITAEDVESVIKIIGRPEEFDQPGVSDRKPVQGIYRRRLYRDKSNHVLGGVCSGIAAYLNTDPVWIRIVFIIFAFAYAISFFVYIGLWIALPSATTELQKRELYGENYYSRFGGKRTGSSERFAGAVNSVLMALGRILAIIFWIFLAIAGVILAVTAFALLFAFVMVFYLKYPVSFFSERVDPAIFSVSAFLDIMAGPSLTPWIMILVSLVVILPLIAAIYWGLKMIFRFRANEMWVSISSLIIWVVSFSALIMIMVSQGINFAERERISEQLFPRNSPDTLYIKTVSRIGSPDFDRELTIPGANYSLYTRGNRLFSKPQIELSEADNGKFVISVEKTMSGSSRREAAKKAEALIFNYSYSGDTLYIDRYYEIPQQFKWSGSFIEARLQLPPNTVVWIDKDAEILFDDEYDEEWELGGKFWLWDGDRLGAPGRKK